jgi:hypothetical protein
MAKFGIDSNMVFDADGKSVAARLSDHDTSLDNLTTDLAERMSSVKSFGAKGDGTTDDTTAIQNAYNSLTNGGTLFFPVGNYKVTSTLNFNKSNVNLVGVGSSSVIKILSNQLADGTRIRINNCSNVFIRDLKFSEINPTLIRSNVYGTLGLEVVSNLSIENVTIDGSNGVGIHGMNCQNVVVSKCMVINTKADGIHFQRGSKNIKVINCYLNNNADDCIAFVSHAPDVYGSCDGFEAYGNTVGGNVTTGSGLCADGSINVKIHDNVIKNTILSGVRINTLTENGTTAYPANVEVYDNTITNSGTGSSGNRDAITVSFSNHVTIRNNNFITATGGITATGCEGIIKIHDNRGISTTTRFIWISTKATNNTLAEITVKNNFSKICGTDGIYIDGTLLKPLLIAVEDNVLDDINNSNGGSGVYGVFVNTASTAIVRSNTIKSANSYTKIGFVTCDTKYQSHNIPQDANENIYIGSLNHSIGGTAPTTGTHALGDIVWNWNPQPSGKIGWVCSVAGTPGTWKAFGAIDA